MHFIYNSPSHSHFPYLFALILHLLQVCLDNLLILDRYSLIEAELWWFYYSSIYIKQEIQDGVTEETF